MTERSDDSWGRLTASETINLIVQSVELLDELENAETPELRRSALSNRAEALVPISFSVQTEPWASVASAMRRFRSAGHNMLAISAKVLHKFRNNPNFALLYLNLLADSSHYGDDQLAFDICRHGVVLSLLRLNGADAQLSLIKLASRGGLSSALAMINHIRQHGILQVRAAAALVRVAASREPGQVTLALSSVQSELEATPGGPVVRELAKDIARRASPYVALKTLSELRVREWPRLVMAMFGGRDPPFRIIATIGAAERLDIEYAGDPSAARIPVAALNADETWHLDICEIAGIRPNYEMEREAALYAPFDGYHGAEQADGSILSVAIKQLAA